MNARRVWEVARKDLEEISTNKGALFGLIFVPALLTLLGVASTYMATQAVTDGRITAAQAPAAIYLSLLLMLLIPTTSSTVVGSMSVVLEKAGRTLEPLLATPIRDRELLWGKAIPPLLIGVGGAYLAFGIVFLAGDIFLAAAHLPIEYPGWTGLFAMLVLATLLGLLGSFVSLLISSRSKELRTAQQLSFLLALPLFSGIIVAFALLPQTWAAYSAAVGILTAATAGIIWLVTDRFQRATILIGAP
ncbi:ABC-2 type transporter [mine drainage metagenome]|uniref:ABC-2 type transporter n=1 Tax=mine drainage metagenome TaxID=410659 RepID=T1A1M7_9ZZZZ